MKKTVLTLLVATMLLTGCAEGKKPVTTDDTSAPTSEATTTTTTTETTKPALVASNMTITEVMTMLIEASGHSVDEALPEYKVGDEIVSYFDEYKGYSPVTAIRGPYVLCITEALTTDRVDTEHNAVSGTYNIEPPFKNPAIQKAYEAFLTLE